MNRVIKNALKKEAGFAPIVVAVVLVLAAFLGTYLVQNRTNFNPFARTINNGNDKPEPFSCEGDNCGDTKSAPCSFTNGEGKTCNGYRYTEYIGPDEEGKNRYGWKDKCDEPITCDEGGAVTPPGGGGGGGNGGIDEEDREEVQDQNCPEQKYYCDFNQDGINGPGKRIYKHGGYYTEDSSDPLYGERDSTGCVYDFKDKHQACRETDERIGTPPEGYVFPKVVGGGGGGNECPDNEMVFCQEGTAHKKKDGKKNSEGSCDYQFEDILDAETNKQCEGQIEGFVITPGVGITPGSNSCQQNVAVYMNAKVATNLMFFYSIMKGTSGVGCVKADMAMDPELNDQPLDGETEGEKEARLYLCLGDDGTIKWRVHSVKTPGSPPVPAKGDYPHDRENYCEIVKYTNVKAAEEKVKIKYEDHNCE